jgi:hypothetical protein
MFLNDMIAALDVIVVMKDEGARVRIAESHDGDAGRFVRAGGTPLADAWLAPEDVASIGLVGSSG